jgi:hypothetical protein
MFSIGIPRRRKGERQHHLRKDRGARPRSIVY